jgi:hypothetical protein
MSANALMAYATYVVALGPGKKLISCHKKEFYGSVIAAVAIIGSENIS